MQHFSNVNTGGFLRLPLESRKYAKLAILQNREFLPPLLGTGQRNTVKQKETRNMNCEGGGRSKQILIGQNVTAEILVGQKARNTLETRKRKEESSYSINY